MTSPEKAISLFSFPLVLQAILNSFRKLNPRHQARNPVMCVVAVCAVLATILFVQALAGAGEASAMFILAISLWLWFTVLFGNFAEAMAEGRGKAQAESLRKARRELSAKKLGRREPGVEYVTVPSAMSKAGEGYTVVSASTLKKGDAVLVEAGDYIPVDGEVLDGIASVDESAITGESAQSSAKPAIAAP